MQKEILADYLFLSAQQCCLEKPTKLITDYCPGGRGYLLAGSWLYICIQIEIQSAIGQDTLATPNTAIAWSWTLHHVVQWVVHSKLACWSTNIRLTSGVRCIRRRWLRWQFWCRLISRHRSPNACWSKSACGRKATWLQLTGTCGQQISRAPRRRSETQHTAL